MKLTKTLLRLTLLLLPLFSASCASVLTTWHKKAYTPVVSLDNPLLESGETATRVEEVTDLAEAADRLYSEGFVLVGFTKFTHTLLPNFQSAYAKMYAKSIGAARAVQAVPQNDGGAYAYTVTYWSKGREFPFGAYYNDVPEETALLFPDSLRAELDQGDRPVLVEAVVHGSPAATAGLADGELIVAIDGESFAGTEELDALVPSLARREVALTVWSPEGLRETRCTFGERIVGADGIGPEGLYYNQPWAFEDYDNFQQYSEAFTNAWHSGWNSYRAQQEKARTNAQLSYLSSEVSHLNGRIDELESRPSYRDSRLDVSQLKAAGARNWENFKGQMDWE